MRKITKLSQSAAKNKPLLFAIACKLQTKRGKKKARPDFE